MGKAKKRQLAGNTTRPRPDSVNVKLDYACLALIVIAASVLILSNLGNQYLWGDEAATALVSKTILTHGVPMGTDGRNFFSQLSGAECTKEMLWVWHPWFPFYLLAGFYAVFGVSTFVARLPFALMGVGTVVLAFYFGRSLWKSRRAGVYSAVLLLASVPFLILVRQCRYYSPEIFLSLLGLYGYHMLLERRRCAALVMGVAAFLLFHTHYVQCAALLGSVIIHSLIFRRDRFKPVLVVSAIVAVVNVPWIVKFAGQGQVLGSYGDLSTKFAVAMGVYCTDVFRYILHPALLLIPVFVCIACHRRTGRLPAYDRDTCARICMLVIFACLTVVGAGVTGQDSYFRYIGPAVPALCLIIALMLDSVSEQVHVAAGVVLVLGIAYWLSMPDYLYEITHDYNGPAKGISTHLNAHGRPGDVVAVNHEDLPLKFYTKMRVVSGVTGEEWTAAKGADWIVIRRQASSVERRFTSYLIPIIRSGEYEPMTLGSPDIPFENREEPALHNFRTVEDADPVVIFHRRTNR